MFYVSLQYFVFYLFVVLSSLFVKVLCSRVIVLCSFIVVWCRFLFVLCPFVVILLLYRCLCLFVVVSVSSEGNSNVCAMGVFHYFH